MKAALVETGGWGGIAHYAWNLCDALSGAGVDTSDFSATSGRSGADWPVCDPTWFTCRVCSRHVWTRCSGP